MDKIASLKLAVEKAFGSPIRNYNDCQKLSYDISATTGILLNQNTLRRFWGIIKSSSKPSLTTLDTLAKYCGATTFDNFQPFSYTLSDERLIEHFIKLFENPNVDQVNNEVFLSVVREVITFLTDQPQLAISFLNKVAPTRLGQLYYFEQFVHIDKLNSFYGHGLEIYLNHKKTDEAQLFGSCLLYLRAWLSKDQQSLPKLYKRINTLAPHENIHPFVAGRWFACTLMHSQIDHTINGDTLLLEARRFHQKLSRASDNYKAFPCFEFVIVEALLLCEYFEEALFYINHAMISYPIKPTYVDQGFYTAFDLFKSMALYGVGKIKEAKKFYRNVDDNNFYFLSRKYFKTLYFIWREKLGYSMEGNRETINSLIAETDFTKLLDLLEDNRKGVKLAVC